MTVVKVLYGQTLVDIAIQYLGDAERVYEIADANGLLLTDELTAGDELLVPDAPPDKKKVTAVFYDEAHAPATAETFGEISDDAFKNEGIGYWFIQQDFIVQ